MVMRIFRTLCAFRSTIILLLTPLILSPLPILVPYSEAKCGYVILLMAVYWIAEVVPLAITALMPMILFPMLGVVDSARVCSNYLKDTNVLFMGGLIVAVAVEKWNLHKRIALRVLLLVGSRPRWLMFGFMVTTAFLSMWMSNTATTAMMVPITQAVLSELKEQNVLKPKGKKSDPYVSQVYDYDANTVANTSSNKNVDSIGVFSLKNLEKEKSNLEKPVSDKPIISEDGDKDDTYFDRISKGLLLCVAYAANIGGTATLTGTGPNLIVSGQAETLYGPEAAIDFGSWFMFSFPGMIICLFLSWIWLQWMYIDLRCLCRNRCCCTRAQHNDNDTNVYSSESASAVLRKQYNELGPMNWAEIAVLCHFILLALLWLTRKPRFIEGWSIIFVDGYVTDSTVGITISFLLFCFPSSLPNFGCLKDGSDIGPKPSLLDWKTVNEKLPWNVLLLLGGGFALADACKVSGLSAWIGAQFEVFSEVPPAAIVFVVTVIVATFTEVASNTATASIFIPILGELGTGLGVNPLYLMVPAAIACSFAFMLPVATPPNAIVFSYGQLSVMDMVKSGFMLNIFCILVVNLMINTLGEAVFQVSQYPSWLPSPDENELFNNISTTTLTWASSEIV